MLNCEGCGLTNRPYDAACSHCARPLQDAEAAAAKRREWDALSPRLREEMERSFDRMLEGTREHLEWLNRHRVSHAVLGALAVNFAMNGATFFTVPWTIPVDLAIGAAAGLALNHWRGGAWLGTGVFLAAGVASFVAKLPFLGTDVRDGGWFVVCFAVFLLALVGHLLGMKLDFDHADRSVTP